MTKDPAYRPRNTFKLAQWQINSIIHFHRLGWSDQEIADFTGIPRITINRVRNCPNPVSAYDG